MRYAILLNDSPVAVLGAHDRLRLAEIADTVKVNTNFAPIPPSRAGGVPVVQLERIRSLFDRDSLRPLREGDVIVLGATAFVYEGRTGGFYMARNAPKANAMKVLGLST